MENGPKTHRNVAQRSVQVLLSERLKFWKHKETQTKLKLKSELTAGNMTNLVAHADFLYFTNLLIHELEYIQSSDNG